MSWISRGFKRKIDRNQWTSVSDTYRNLVTWDWDEIKSHAPDYFNRLAYSVEKSQGRVLEIGAGIGNMTKWLSVSGNVTEIYAVDGFREAIHELEQLKLRNVSTHLFKVEDVQFNAETIFDTFVMCEVLEHIYPEEELRMLKNLRKNFTEKTRFIISTPIGWMEEPYHVRSFDKSALIKHIEKYYGKIIQLDYSAGYSQIAYGTFKS